MSGPLTHVGADSAAEAAPVPPVEMDAETGGGTPRATQKNEQPTPSLSLPSALVPTFRLCRKLLKHNIRASTYMTKLTDLTSSGRTPRGLTPNRFPLKVTNPSIGLQLRWDEAHVDLSKRLTDLLIEHWSLEVDDSHKKIQQVLEEAQKTAPQEAMAHLRKLLAKAEDDIRRDILVKKRQPRQPQSSAPAAADS